MHDDKLSIEQLVNVTSHNVVQRFGILGRGYLREGYWADVAIVDMHATTTDTPERVLYKCGWSPFDGIQFRSQIATTIVNGHQVYAAGEILTQQNYGERLEFSSD